MKQFLILSILLISSSPISAADNTALLQAINGEHRTEQHKSRDKFRHPLQTLNFFEVEADMTVVEIWPGGMGWYTEILAPFLKAKGKLYAANFSADSGIPYFTKSIKKFNQKILANPLVYNNVSVTALFPPKAVNIAPLASADRILTFRNVHNWMKSGQAKTVFKVMFDTLKPLGILGVVEHRALVDSRQDPKAISGYVTEDYVIKLAETAGFKLLDKAEINANPKDKTIHPKGVWTLPPSLRLKELNKDQYIEIGESDRMTLKFIKPTTN